MGQYWMAVNLDKKEFVHPHKLGCGMKLWEQLANQPSTGTALIVLCAAMPERRGGGDLDLVDNWHGPEREADGKHAASPGPMPPTYQEIAHRTIGRWAGDRIAFVGDYAEDSDLPKKHKASTIFKRCGHYDDEKRNTYKDITDDVCAVIEHELQGKFEGDGWRRFVQAGA